MNSASLSIDDMYFAPRRRESAAALGDALAVGLALLNVGGGLASGLWLVGTGEWALVVGGVAGGVAMPWAVAKLGAPITGLVGRANRAAMPPRTATLAAGVPCELCAAVLVSAWTLAAYLAVTRFAQSDLTAPLAIWGYAITMAPLSYLARSKARDTQGAHLALLMAIGMYAMLIVLCFAGATLLTMAVAALTLAVAEGLYCAASGAAHHLRRGNLRST